MININEEIDKLLMSFGATLIEYINSKNIIIQDNEGYKYKANKSNMLRSNKLPHRFRGNPFVIENIKTYLKNIGSTLSLISMDYIDCKHKLKFVCRIHSDKVQEKTLDDVITQGGRCKYCYYESIGERCRVDDDVLKLLCDQKKLIYVDRFVKNQETHIRYMCPIHTNKGIQEISLTHLKDKAIGCPYCSGWYKNTIDFASEIENIHPYIEITGTYKGAESHVDCKCIICGHTWSPLARSLKNGEGCPFCKMSKGEKRIKLFLDNHNIHYTYQKRFDGCFDQYLLPFDFYLPDKNLVIEFDGEQHFMPVDFANKGLVWAKEIFQKIAHHDNIKNNYCFENGIKILRIPYFNFDNIEDILNHNLIVS